jgi:hypothetical protein
MEWTTVELLVELLGAGGGELEGGLQRYRTRYFRRG